MLVTFKCMMVLKIGKIKNHDKSMDITHDDIVYYFGKKIIMIYK